MVSRGFDFRIHPIIFYTASGSQRLQNVVLKAFYFNIMEDYSLSCRGRKQFIKPIDKKLIEVFGKILGVYFHNAANGVDNEPVVEQGEAESISRIGTLKQDTRDLEFILQKTDRLTEEVGKEVALKDLCFKQVSIVAITTNLTTKSRSVTLEQPAKDIDVIKRNVRSLFEKYLSESTLDVRRVGVKVSHFCKEEREQKQLTSFFS